jgi:hypothetical protein
MWFVEWVARDHLAPWGHSPLGAGTSEGTDSMAAGEEKWNQTESDCWHRIRNVRVRSEPMAESFLEEQLKRIKEMTEQMSRVRMFRETDDVGDRSSEERDSARDHPSPAHQPARRASSRRRAR